MASTITVSWSEIDAFRQCPHKHQLSYLERWSKPPKPGSALSKGTLWHQVMEVHYNWIMNRQRSGASWLHVPKAELQLLDKAIRKVLDEAPEDDAELIEWMYKGYLDHYGFDLDWEILAVENTTVLWLPTPLGNKSRFRIKVKLDLVVRWQGKLWVVDHKSGKDLPSDKMLELADQFGLYIWGLQKAGKRIYGSIHNAARTQRNVSKPQPLPERFMRTPMFRTPTELERIAHEAYATVATAYSARNRAERHANEDTCRWRCDFTEACLLGRKTTDRQEREALEAYGFERNYDRH